MTSATQKLKRALVKVILALAAAHSFRATVGRDSSDAVVAEAARKAALKVKVTGILRWKNKTHLACVAQDT